MTTFQDTHEWIDGAIAQILGNRDAWAVESNAFETFDANFKAMEASIKESHPEAIAQLLTPNYAVERASHTSEGTCSCRVCYWAGVKAS